MYPVGRLLYGFTIRLRNSALVSEKFQRRSSSARLQGAMPAMESLLALSPRSLWQAFWCESAAFISICFYLIVEYVRPQSIFPSIDIVPWAQSFLLAAAVTLRFDPSRAWVRATSNVWIVSFAIVILISCLQAHYIDVSLSRLWDMLGWIIIYFLIINIVNSEQRLFVFLLIFLLASFKLSQHGAVTWALRGFAFTTWGITGPKGPFENSGEFSVQMLMSMPIAYQLAIALRPHLTWVRFTIVLAMPATAVLSVLGASSRGSQIAMIVQWTQMFMRRGRIVTSLILAICFGTATWYFIPQDQIDRFTTMGDDRSSEQRILYWKRGIDMIKEEPILGVGYYNFAAVFEERFPQDMLYSKAQVPHNIFIQVGTDAGLVGLTLFLGLIACLFAANRSTRRSLSASPGHWMVAASFGYDAACIGFLIAGQFVTIAYYPFFWMQLALSVATSNVAGQIGQNYQSCSRASEWRTARGRS